MHTGLDCRGGAIDLGDHALIDHAGLLEFGDLGDAQVGDHGSWILRILEQARDITHKDQAFGVQGDGCLCCRHVRVAVINMAILATRRGTDYRGNPFLDTIKQDRGVYPYHFAHVADVQCLAVRAYYLSSATRENVGPRKPLSIATRAVYCGYNFRIDLAREYFINDADCRFIGYALALDEFGREPRLFHRAGYRFSTAMDDHRINLDGFEKDNVSGDTIANVRVG